MIGNQATPAQLNSQIGNIALALRGDFAALVNFVTWFNTQNTQAAIETNFGLSPADALTMQAVVGNLQTLSEIYAGTAEPAAAFDYRDNSAILWGGQ
jgi:hypothetical protein